MLSEEGHHLPECRRKLLEAFLHGLGTTSTFFGEFVNWVQRVPPRSGNAVPGLKVGTGKVQAPGMSQLDTLLSYPQRTQEPMRQLWCVHTHLPLGSRRMRERKPSSPPTERHAHPLRLTTTHFYSVNISSESSAAGLRRQPRPAHNFF